LIRLYPNPGFPDPICFLIFVSDFPLLSPRVIFACCPIFHIHQAVRLFFHALLFRHIGYNNPAFNLLVFFTPPLIPQLDNIKSTGSFLCQFKTVAQSFLVVCQLVVFDFHISHEVD